MARGNYVDGVDVEKRFGMAILTPVFKEQSFTPYKKVSISKSGTLIGYWGDYKDYLSYGWAGYKILRVSDKYIFLNTP